MSSLLSFESPLEFLLRYTVIAGVVLAIAGVTLMLIARRVTMAKRNTENIDKSDIVYRSFFITGLCLLLLGMIVMALPISSTLYKG